MPALNLNRSQITILAFPLLILGLNLTCYGQSAANREYHCFFDLDKNPLAVGVIEKVENDEIHVLEGQIGKRATIIPLAKLTKADKAYVKTWLREEARQKREIEKLKLTFSKIKSKSSRQKIKSLAEAAQTGSSEFCETCLQITRGKEVAEVREQAFYSFLSTCEPTPANYKLALEILEDDVALESAISKKPTSFFSCIQRFRKPAINVYKHAAFFGELEVTPEEIGPKATPILLSEPGSYKNQIRALGAYHYAKAGPNNINQFSSKEKIQSELSILKAAQQKVNGAKDMLTIEALITGWAEAGTPSASSTTYKHNEIAGRYRDVFPDKVRVWKRNSDQRKDFVQKQLRLFKMSQMQNFNDINGNFLIRGTPKNCDEKNVVFDSFHAGLISVPLIKFSKEDQKKLQSRVGEK